MSMVPLLFRDWWDDFDRERPSRLLDQHFGLGLKKDDLFNAWPSTAVPRSGRYYRPWGEPLLRSSSGSSNIKADDKTFQVYSGRWERESNWSCDVKLILYFALCHSRR